jgi:hypothetical protein
VIKQSLSTDWLALRSPAITVLSAADRYGEGGCGENSSDRCILSIWGKNLFKYFIISNLQFKRCRIWSY